MDADDFSKKKSSSSGLKKEKAKDKTEGDDKLVRKSKSMKSVSTKKSSDQIKNPNSMRSPSLKSIFGPQYEQQRDGKVIMESSDSEEEDDAFVPHQHPNLIDEDNNFSAPIRVPSAPGRMSSPSSHSYSPSPSPTLVSLHTRASSPSPSSSPYPISPTGKRSPGSPTFFAPQSPASTSPTARVPAFTQSPPQHVMVPTPHVIMADDLDAQFGNRSQKDDTFLGNRSRTDSISDDFGSAFGSGLAHSDSRVSDSEPIDMETDEMIHQKKSGLFSFGSNKPMKLKA